MKFRCIVRSSGPLPDDEPMDQPFDIVAMDAREAEGKAIAQWRDLMVEEIFSRSWRSLSITQRASANKTLADMQPEVTIDESYLY